MQYDIAVGRRKDLFIEMFKSGCLYGNSDGKRGRNNRTPVVVRPCGMYYYLLIETPHFQHDTGYRGMPGIQDAECQFPRKPIAGSET